MVKRHRLVLLLLFSVLPIAVLAADDDALKSWSRKVNVIALESNQVSKNQTSVVPLTSADLPVRLSKAYLTLSSSARLPTNDLGMTGDLSLLDVYTFKFSEKEIEKAKRVKRENNFTGLRYSLTVQNWTDESCQVEFAGSYGGNLPRVVAQLSRTTTTLIRVDRLCFAFTFVDAAIKADERMRVAKTPDPKKNISYPRPIKQPVPKYPPELRRNSKQGNFYFLAIITKEGTVDQSHGIVLECFHWLFARNALQTIFNSWEFTPAQLDHQPINIMAEIQVAYRLY